MCCLAIANFLVIIVKTNTVNWVEILESHQELSGLGRRFKDCKAYFGPSQSMGIRKTPSHWVDKQSIQLLTCNVYHKVKDYALNSGITCVPDTLQGQFTICQLYFYYTLVCKTTYPSILTTTLCILESCVAIGLPLLDHTELEKVLHIDLLQGSVNELYNHIRHGQVLSADFNPGIYRSFSPSYSDSIYL